MIADASAWIEYMRGTGSSTHLRLRKALSRGEPVYMIDAVYQEVLQGAGHAAQFIRLQDLLDSVPAWTPDDSREVVRQAAMLYARCRWRGITIRSPNDCLIAASAIEAGQPLLHADRDFERIAAIDSRLQFA